MVSPTKDQYHTIQLSNGQQSYFMRSSDTWQYTIQCLDTILIQQLIKIKIEPVFKTLLQSFIEDRSQANFTSLLQEATCIRGINAKELTEGNQEHLLTSKAHICKHASYKCMLTSILHDYKQKLLLIKQRIQHLNKIRTGCLCQV